MTPQQLALPEAPRLVGQNARVFGMLREWTCGTEFLAAYLPRYGARIWDLKRLGYVIEKKRCTAHQHVSIQWAWRLRSQKEGVV